MLNSYSLLLVLLLWVGDPECWKQPVTIPKETALRAWAGGAQEGTTPAAWTFSKAEAVAWPNRWEVSFFIGTSISPGQPQGRQELQNSFSSSEELGGLDGPEGSLSVRWLLNPGDQQSSGCYSSISPGPASSEAQHASCASQEAHTHTNPGIQPIYTCLTKLMNPGRSTQHSTKGADGLIQVPFLADHDEGL